ncbi:hypothetical protein HNY73_005052 [Argiope bruennichi]|uniref:Endonuclease/exonuclease/phosphatase domain-containing protein n=1 Tax=Argiope bruennichi TaxID=94029 RepID=A0A8T0FIB9_ARGBR|nr:hypothetical protein HNY73_005052 [Argiope bruennichi]
MESEDLIPGTPESQQGIFNNFERSHFSAVNDLQTFIAKHKLKSNAAVELMGIFTRLVESFDMGAINKRLENLEQKVGIPASPPAQPITKTYASVAQQWSQGLLPTPNLPIQNREQNPPISNIAKPPNKPVAKQSAVTPAKPLAKQSAITPAKQTVRQRAPEQAKRQKTTEKAEFVALPTIIVAPLNSDPMEEENTTNLNLKSLLEANIRPKALGVRIISCREARSKNILISVPTQEMASKLLEAINVHDYLKTICEARFPQKRDPQIIIYDVDNTDQNKNDEEENFINRIKEDNNLPDGKIRVLFRKPGRGARSHWVLSLSPNIFKGNLGRSFKATKELPMLLNSNTPDIYCVQEPYLHAGSSFFPSKWRTIHHPDGSVLISIRNPNIAVVTRHIDKLFVCVDVSQGPDTFTIISFYFPPSSNKNTLFHKLNDMLEVFKPKQWFLVGDGNIQSELWGPDRDDIKRKRDIGAPMIDFIIHRNLLVWNDYTAGPTFETKNGKSWIDVTLSTSSLYDRKEAWQLERSTLSDHSYILFSLAGNNHLPPTRSRFSKRKLKLLGKTLEKHFKSHLETTKNIKTSLEVQRIQVKFENTILDPELYETTCNPYDQHPCEWLTFPFLKKQPSGEGIEIFTDGSKIGDRVGSAIACFYFGKLVFVDSHRLDDHSTVFQAEAYAFVMALNYIDLTNPWSKVSIYSDSLSLLSALASPNTKAGC